MTGSEFLDVLFDYELKDYILNIAAIIVLVLDLLKILDIRKTWIAVCIFALLIFSRFGDIPYFILVGYLMYKLIKHPLENNEKKAPLTKYDEEWEQYRKGVYPDEKFEPQNETECAELDEFWQRADNLLQSCSSYISAASIELACSFGLIVVFYCPLSLCYAFDKVMFWVLIVLISEIPMLFSMFKLEKINKNHEILFIFGISPMYFLIAWIPIANIVSAFILKKNIKERVNKERIERNRQWRGKRDETIS